jgi:hypothetical protein
MKKGVVMGELSLLAQTVIVMENEAGKYLLDQANAYAAGKMWFHPIKWLRIRRVLKRLVLAKVALWK